MGYRDFKNLTGRTGSDKILCDKAFNIPKNPKYDEYHRGLPSMAHKFFDKTSAGGAVTLANKSAFKNEIMSNKEIAEELHQQIIRKFKKRKVHSSFIDNIWSADLADMQLMSKFNKGICFYYVLLIFLVNAPGMFL